MSRLRRVFDAVLDDPGKMPDARSFVGAKLNFTENLLYYRDDRAALVFGGEGLESVKIIGAELYDSVACLAKALREHGVTVGSAHRIA